MLSQARDFANTLLAQCCTEGALADAWARVHANDGCPGCDGMSVARFHENALSQLTALRREVASGCYRAQPLLGVQIPKARGGFRLLGIPVVRDRVLQTAVAQLLTRLLDPEFDDASFAYRSGRSVQQATARIVDCRNQGLRWVVDADIERYFDTVHHATLLTMLRRRLPDDSLTSVLAQWLAAPIQQDGVLQPRRKGVPQGAPISPLLSNVYLHVLDRTLADASYTLVRYADDFLVLCRSRLEAESALAMIREVLESLHLKLNEEKTRITHFQAGFRFLGVRFEGEQVCAVDDEAAPWVLPAGRVAEPDRAVDGGLPLAAAEAQPPCQSANDSCEDAPELIDPSVVQLDDEGDGLELPRSLYITSQGLRLSRQQSRLIVSRGQDVVARVPLRLLDLIVVQGNAMISTAIVRHCRDEGTMLAFTDANGINPVVLDGAPEISLALLEQQVRRHDDAAFGMAVARACIVGKLHNCRAVLRSFSRRGSPDVVARAMVVLEAMQRRVERVSELDALRGCEGRAARAYFAALSALLPENWQFSGRNRMPPRDPFNAMLSYGYAVLSHTLHATVRLARLHAGFGHLHAVAPNRPALVCDLMEEFRPLVVDTVALTMARKRSLNPDEDFVAPDASGAFCKMLPAARQLLIARLEARLAAPIATRDGHGKSCLFRMLRAQVARYASSLGAGAPYRPYRVP